MTSLAIGGIVSHLVTLVGGYFLRHYKVPVPVLPSANDQASGHVTLIQQVLKVSEAEAVKLLDQAVQQILQQGLADLAKATQAK